MMRSWSWRLVLLVLAAVAVSAAAADDAPTEATTVETGTLTTADGNALVYEVRAAVHDVGEPTLVFVHCWACDRSVWREQVDVFAEDHRVVTFDLPGHGESGAERDS